MKKRERVKSRLTKLYLTALGVFLTGLLIVLLSPNFLGRNFNFSDAELNEFQVLSNNMRVALTRKEFNPEKEFVRLDFMLEQMNRNSSLANVDFEITSQHIIGRYPLDVDVIRVNDQYLVANIKGVPSGFSVLSVTINPEYIFPELEVTNDLENRRLTIHINESGDIVNEELEIGTIESYREEFIDVQEGLLRKEKAEKEAEIEINNLAISTLNARIKDLEELLDYKTQNERLETNITINSNRTSIIQHENNIEGLQNEIEELEERIELLGRRRNSSD